MYVQDFDMFIFDLEMKSPLISVILVLFLLPGLSSAQSKGRLCIGPKLGYNLARVNLSQSSVLHDMAVGLSVDYWLNGVSTISLDIIKSDEGYKVPLATIEYSYLQIPVTYQTFFGLASELFQPKFYLGFSPGLLSKAEVNGVDFKDQHTKAALNLIGGFGTLINLTPRLYLDIDMRGFLGLTGIELQNSNPEPLKNRTMQFSAAIRYGI
ncbi:MAG: outer membrane beta-barrel protein [Saprospiraceae bacterium]|nr:outer membrane beta-barrel protein [Saprospiraceae bacterium]